MTESANIIAQLPTAVEGTFYLRYGTGTAANRTRALDAFYIASNLHLIKALPTLWF